MVSGSNRSYAFNSADVCAERLLFVENWCGSHEQSLACLAQGHGFHGHHIADLVIKSLPAVLTQAAVEVAFRPRTRPGLSGKGVPLGGGKGGHGAGTPVELIFQPRDKILAAARLMAKAAGVTEDGKLPDPHALHSASTGPPSGRKPTPGTTEHAAALAGRTVAQQRMVEVVQAAFQKVQQGLVDEAERGVSRVDVASSGTSLLLCIVRGKALLVAGAGLCRAVLGREVDGRELKDAVLAARQPTKTGTGGHAGLAMLRQFAEDAEAKHAQHVELHAKVAQEAAEHGLGSSSALSLLPRLKYFTAKDGRQLPRSGLKFTTHEAKYGVGTAIPSAERPLLSGVYNRSSAMSRLTHLISETAIVDTSATDLSKGTLDPEEEQRRKVLHSASMPTFPDLPPVIERALQFKEETYLKPSSLLQAKRAELVKLMTAKAESRGGGGVDGGSTLGGDPWASGMLRSSSPLRVTPAGQPLQEASRTQAGLMGSAGELSMLGSATRRSQLLARELRAQLSLSSRPPVPMLQIDSANKAGAGATAGLGTAGPAVTAGQWSGGGQHWAQGGRPQLSQPSAVTLAVGGVGEGGDMEMEAEEGSILHASGPPPMRLVVSAGVGGAAAAREGEIVELDPSAGPVDYSVPPPEFESTSLGQGVLAKFQPMIDDLAAIRSKTAALGGAGQGLHLQPVGRTPRRVGGVGGGAQSLSASRGSARIAGSSLPPDMGERVIATGVRDLMGMRGVTLEDGPLPEDGLPNFKRSSSSSSSTSMAGRHGGGSSSSSTSTAGGYGQGLDKTIDLQSRLSQELSEARMFDEQGRPVRVIVPLPLVSEHRPDRPDESARVHIAGGRVSSGHLSGGARGGIPRVFGPHMEGPGLATSRCLGYTSAAQYGVSAEPEVMLRVLQPDDRFVILASEGLWAVMSSSEAVDVVSHTLNAILWGGTAEGEYRRMAEEARRKMAAEAKARGRAAGVEEDEEGEEEGEGKSSEEDEPVPAAHSGSAFASLKDVLRPVRAPPEGLDHPAIQAVTFDPSLGARPALPGIAHPSPSVHVTPSPVTEMVVHVAPGQAPVAGAGSGADTGVMDLLDSFMPPLARARRADRLRRVAISAAEALVGVAKGKWAAHVAKYVHAAEEGKASGGGSSSSSSSGSPVIKAEHIIHQDISVLVVLLDHA